MAERLKVENLSVSFDTPAGEVQVLREVSLELREGETLALVGESGCGKSVLCKSIMKLLPGNSRITGGHIWGEGEEITGYKERQMQKLRGSLFSMIFQDPLSSLNPAISVGRQIGEGVALHDPRLCRKDIYSRVIELMALVGIERPRERYSLYPGDFSGGMRQRCVMAIALASQPRILLADEPTTALDVTIQAQMLDLLGNLKRRLGMAVLLVTHDLAVAAGAADRMAVMRKGKIVETGTAEEIFYMPRHSYTRELLQSHPAVAGREKGPGVSREGHQVQPDLQENQILLEVNHLIRHFPLGKKAVVQAVDDVSFQIRKGEIFGLVGESGSGKSTVARCVMNICRPDEGSIVFKGIDTLDKRQAYRQRKTLHTARGLIFQDSAASLNRRMKVAHIIAEPMQAVRRRPQRGGYRAEAEFLLKHVGLDGSYLDKYPFELSGGERQRVAIARALSMEPELLVADEPLASLDAPVQWQIIQLFQRLQKEHGFAFLFIAHDLAVVRYLCHRVGVMRRGKLVETASAKEIFEAPRHPYTKELLAAIPAPDPMLAKRT